MYRVSESKLISASQDVLWDIMTDFQWNGEQAPNLQYQHPEYDEDGALTGMVCANLEGVSWREDVLIWEPKRIYKSQVDTSKYPYPLKTMIATNQLEAIEEGTHVTISFDFEPDFPQPIRWLMSLYAKRVMRTILKTGLDNWEQEAQKRQINS